MVFLLMIGMGYAGFGIQPWGFTDIPPKPLLYDLVSRWDLWSPSLCLFLPVVWLSARLGWSQWALGAGIALHALLLTLVLFFAHDRSGVRLTRGRWVQILGMPALVWLLTDLVPRRWWVRWPIGDLILCAAVLAVYLYLLLCFGRGILRALRPPSTP